MARRCQGERRGAASQGELEEHESREMLAETGHYALILALGVAIVQMVLPLVGARIRDQQLMAVAAKHAQGRIVSLLEGGYELHALGRSVAAHLKVLGEF